MSIQTMRMVWLEVGGERERQLEEEGFSFAHDDQHAGGELAAMAAVYAMPPTCREWDVSSVGYSLTLDESLTPEGWVGKFGDRRRELVKAAALILAEIERLDRAANKTKNSKRTY